ncbi:MAG: PAS domain S-box protein [Candidatus Omnitrophica bacterium]|nr:PAS domain S-box protein [Candidatus Omnitrophota bacterium]
MEHTNKTAEQLVAEIAELRRRLSGLEQCEIERRETQEMLRSSEIRLKHILSSMVDYVFVFDKDARFIFCQAPSPDLYVTPEKFIGERHADVMPAHLHEPFEKAFLNNQRGESASFEYVLDINNQARWFAAQLSPIFINGAFMGSVAVVRDVTAQKKAEETAKKTAAQLRALFQATPSVIIELAPGGEIVELNHEAELLYGQRREEILGKNYFETFLPDELRETIAEDFLGALEGKPTRGFVNPVRCADGRMRVFRWDVNPVRGDDGAHIGIVAIGQDVTMRYEIEEQLAENKMVLEGVFHALDDAVLVLEAATMKILDCNPAASRIFGYAKEQVIDQTMGFLHVDQESHQEFKKQLYTAIDQKGALRRFAFPMKRRDGTVFLAEHDMLPLLDKEGVRTGWVRVVRDISGQQKG